MAKHTIKSYSSHKNHYYKAYHTMVIHPPPHQMYQSKDCLHLKADVLTPKSCVEDRVRLRDEQPCRLGNFSFIMSIVDFLKRPAFVSVKSYTMISTSCMSRVDVLRIFLFRFLFPLEVGNSIISNVYLLVNAFLLLVLYQCTFVDFI